MDEELKDFLLVIERLKKTFSYKSDKDLALALGMTPTAFHNRKKRCSLPYPEIIAFANSQNVNLNWILTGVGSIYNNQKSTLPNNSSSLLQDLKNEGIDLKKVIDEHHDLVDEFIDKPTGKEFNSILLEIEKRSSKEYYGLLGYAKRVLSELDKSKENSEDKGVEKNTEDTNQTVKKIT